MKWTYWLVFFHFLITCEARAQGELSNAQIDSLLKANASFIHKEPVHSFELAKKIYKASKQNNYDLGLAMSLYKISLYHSEIVKDYKKALAYNDEGYESAKRINNDSLLLFFTLSKATIYGSLGLEAKAIAMVDECLKNTNSIANLKKRSLFRGDLFTYKAHFLTNSTPAPSTSALLQYSIQAMKEYEKALDQCVNPGYTNVGTYYLDLKDYDKAAYYLKKAVAFFKRKHIITCEIEYTNLSALYTEIGQYETALSYLDSSNTLCFKKPSENYYLISQNYEGYKKIYTKLNDKDSIIKYQNLELAYKDSLAFQSENKLDESMDYMMSKNENENEQLEADKQVILWGSIVGIWVVGGLLTFYYKKRSKSFKDQTELKEKDMEKDLDLKATEIQQLKQKVSTSYDELIEMAKKDNPLFVSFFKELYPDFYQKLKQVQPDLTVLEQKVCFYLKLKFTTKEIAEYTFVSVKAIQNRKNRLRKRLFIEEGKDIYDWIDQLD